MLEDEKSFSEGDDLLQEIPTDISNFLYNNEKINNIATKHIL